MQIEQARRRVRAQRARARGVVREARYIIMRAKRAHKRAMVRAQCGHVCVARGARRAKREARFYYACEARAQARHGVCEARYENDKCEAKPIYMETQFRISRPLTRDSWGWGARALFFALRAPFKC